MTRYYLDTSIWIDLFENRGERGRLVAKFVKKIINENSRIFYSDIVIRELKDIGYQYSELRGKYRPFRLILVYVCSERKEAGKAKDISEKRKVPKGDVLHAFIARRFKCVLIAHDQHFGKLKDIIKSKRLQDTNGDDISFQSH